MSFCFSLLNAFTQSIKHSETYVCFCITLSYILSRNITFFFFSSVFNETTLFFFRTFSRFIYLYSKENFRHVIHYVKFPMKLAFIHGKTHAFFFLQIHTRGWYFAMRLDVFFMEVVFDKCKDENKCFHSGSILYPLMEKLILLSVEINEIFFFMQTVLQDDNGSPQLLFCCFSN